MNNIIKAIIDVSVKGSNELKSLKDRFNDAEGARGKFGVGMGLLKEHTAAAALSAGTALAGFAIKAIGDFQSLALEVGKFSDKTGVLPEDASRLIEVFGDVGVEAGTVEGAIDKMNKKLGASPGAFEELGLKAVIAKDGVIDTNATFIAAIEHLNGIKDPAQRAAEGAKIFGKQWGELAEIIEAGDIESALAAVSDAKIIDQGEIDKARDFRDMWDTLKGRLEDFALAIGERAVPAITSVVGSIEKIAEAAEPVLALLRMGMQNTFSEGAGASADLNRQLAELGKRYDEMYVSADQALGAVSDGKGALDSSTEAMLRMAGVDLSPPAEGLEDIEDAADDAKVEFKNFGREWDTLKGKLNDEESYNSAVDALEEIEAAALEAFGTGMKGTAEEAEAAQKNLRDAVLNGKQAVADYLEEVLKIPADKATYILALIDEGYLAEAQAAIDELTKAKEVDVNMKVRISGDKGWGGIPLRASGGPMSAGKPYITHADELVVPDEDKHVFSAAQTAQIMGNSGSGTPLGMGGGSGVTINLTVHAGMLGQDVPRMAVEALRQAVQSMGATTVQKAIGL